MKTRILIPRSLIELTGEIQACLSLAKLQGFNIDKFELGVSSTQAIELESPDREQIIVTTDLISSDCNLSHKATYNLVYQSASISRVTRRSCEDIYLNVSDVGSQLDVWTHPITGESRALKRDSKSSSDNDNHRHLAWVTTLLALDFPIEDSLTLARAMTSVSRETWAFEFDVFPTPVLEDGRLDIKVGWSLSLSSALIEFPTLTKSSLGLYPVVDDVTWIERLLPMGINTIQLRIKDPDQSDLEQQVVRAIELGREHNAQVFINDYWQLALKHGAFGIHLGQEDIDESNLEILADAGICLGLSTHGYYELLRIIQIQPSYIALGHIFPTTTKKMPSLPQGLVRLKLYQQLIDTIPYGEKVGFPTVAIGGIDATNADQVWDSGVSSLAVVRAITLADDPQQVIDEFAQVMKAPARVIKDVEVV
ncbi:thiamine phosphate synthase [Vibrio maerlii]|uniref:thiamine phosphate synthase n=1 Tax=Vibrio maerlii TaxID=2231648 RepID=UPI000E3D910C|nr:thiamine phosphate synthase [Vibrio maerlii]